jgi:hypothetical protein
VWLVNRTVVALQAIIQKQLAGQLGYMDDLLARTHRRFVAQYKADLIVCCTIDAAFCGGLRALPTDGQLSLRKFACIS